MADDAGVGFFEARDAVSPGATSADDIRRLLNDLQGRVDRSLLRDPEDLAALAAALECLARKVAANREAAVSAQGSLAASIETLARRIDGQAMTQARLSAQLADVEARMEQRLETVVDEIAAMRTLSSAGAPQRRGPRTALAAAALMAGLSVLAAVGLFLARESAPAADARQQALSAQEHPSL